MAPDRLPHNDNPADIKALDLLMSTLTELNMVDSENEHGGDTRYATGSKGMPYWHVEQAALKAAANLLGGNKRRASELYHAMIRDGEDVRRVLARLREEWAGSDPVGEAVHAMMRHADLNSQADVIQWAAVRTGIMWPCVDGNCRYVNTDAVDECESCGTARPGTRHA